ncbi:unnamed protein product [Rhodiola kirilowii]
MSLLRDPTIKLFGKTIPLSAQKLAAAGPLEVSTDSDAGEFSGGVRFEVCDDESSKDLEEEVGDFDEKKHVVEVDADDHHGESSHKGSSGIIDLDMEGSSNGGLKNGDQSGYTSGVVDGKSLKRPDKILPCPRCNSMETKFCYYNNYNVNQPRHFCKKCQRYWTAGGSMRNVPVGSGRRKSKSSSGSFCRQALVNEAALQSNQCSDASGVLRFGSDAPLCDSMANVLNLAENRENYCQIGGEYQIPDKRIHVMGNRDAGSSKVNSSASNTNEKGNESQDAMLNFQGYPVQVPFYPGPQWPTPWNPSMPPPHMGLAGYPVGCYSMQNYWTSGMMGSWIHPSSISSPSTPSTHGSLSSSPNSPTLGKHSRNGTIMNADDKVAPSEPKASRGIWIPKTLRIDDPSQAAKSSIWETLGIQNEKSSTNEGGIFRGNYKVLEKPRHLHTNPAALSRSQNFHETTSMNHTST